MFALDLGDHLLWPDGDISVEPDQVINFVYKLEGHLEKLKVTKITKEIQDYNKLSETPLSIKEEINWDLFPPFSTIPEKYKYLNLDEYLINLSDKIERDDLLEERIKRLSHEIWLFKELKLDDILKTVIFIVDTMKSKNMVWGVGRGSSCSSYLLFLLELHDVDPVFFGIEITDFIRGK